MTVWTMALAGWLMIGPVLLRNGAAIEPERVEGFAEQGVNVRPSFDASGPMVPALVPWREVLDIEGGWGEAAAYRSVADATHRAELRLARGDATGAIALLEPLAGAYLDRSGPTSGAIASALAVCRLLRSDRAGAAGAWLAWRSNPLGPPRDWIDAETALAPMAPPVFAERDARAFLSVPAERSGVPEHAGELSKLYRAAADAIVNGRPVELAGPETRLRADPGVRLVWEMVRARADPDASGRLAARDALRRRMRTAGAAWQIAWCHLGIGASMMAEDDRLEADAGAAELISVVLFDQGTAAGLADLAADLLIEYFETTQRPEHADSVRAMDRAAMSGLLPGRRSETGTQTESAEPAPADATPEDLP